MVEQKQAQLTKNLQDTGQWVRILYMLLFGIILYWVVMFTGLLIVLQALFAIVTGSDNQNLRQFAASLANYINQIILFLTYNDARKPFPFAKWGELETVVAVATAEQETTIEIEPTASQDHADK